MGSEMCIRDRKQDGGLRSFRIDSPLGRLLGGIAARDAAVDDVVRHGAEPARGHDGEGAADEAGDPEIGLLEELELFSGIASCGHAAYVAHN